MNFETIVRQQQQTSSLVFRFLTNLKKVGQEKLSADLYESRLELLENYWIKFQKQEDDLIQYAEYSSSGYSAGDLFSQVEEAYLNAKTHMREQLRRLASKVKSETPPSKPTTGKLPKLALPTFAGDYLQWETFRDLFTSVVHNAPELSNAARLQYLKSLLTGEAAALLSNIAITDGNYDGAWKALQDRYDNQRILLAHHLNRLLGLKPMTTDTASQLKTLLDGTNETRRALQNLGRPVEHWDDWFVHHTVQKLELNLRKDWETRLGARKQIPTFAELCEFLTGRLRALETLEESSHTGGGCRRRPNLSTVRTHSTQVQRPAPEKCPLCHERHYLGYCPAFKGQTPQQRRDTATRLHLCFNCLKPHAVQSCPSVHRCFTCKAAHHTLLHLEKVAPTAETPSRVSSAHAQTPLAQNPMCRHTLLATASVKVTATDGRSATVRALLDQGSEATFISEDLVQRLQLPRRRVQIPVVGIGAAKCGTAKAVVHVQLSAASARCGATSIQATALVLPNLIKTFRPHPVSLHSWPQIESISLADDDSSSSSRIDLVIGADFYGQTLLDGLIKGPPGMPVAQNTIFGWVLSGRVDSPRASSPEVSNFHCSVDCSLLEALRKFWEIEEINHPKMLTPDERHCEEQFQRTHARTPEGRFVVRLPRRPDVLLGESRNMALRSLQRGEARRRKDPDLDIHYRDFLKEYLQLGHMAAVPPSSDHSSQLCYLPHHAVWKVEGSQRKIRVVFNASARTSSGNSLNDALLPGPKLQQELSHILLRWRTYPIVFSADIIKMFRQIWVHPEDQPLQRILWRESPEQPIQEYQLSTVTYGTACAPYLAIRCLLQLAKEGAGSFPEAARVLQTQTYVDDLFAGADTLERALDLKAQLEGLLTAGGFQLAKWSSNVPQLSVNPNCNHFLTDGTVKTLGVLWNPATDTFSFRVKLETPERLTKRSILSNLAKFFDPFGWLAPVLITGKLFLQDLWTTKSDWDAPVPPSLEEAWTRYYHGLDQLESLRIPRWIPCTSGELHGFCDASQRAYAAAVYLRVTREDGTFITRLLAAKTKVAPLKVISLPRLELCGAVLLTRLLHNISEGFSGTPFPTHAWTDSQVVLHWINAVPARWKCFVANRVSEIHQTLPQTVWHHVVSADNPADPASRGVPAASIRDNSLWWHGPHWLSEPSPSWPASTLPPFSPEALQEENLKVQAFNLITTDHWNLSERYSSLNRLLRVTSWLFRFHDNARTPKGTRNLEPLSVPELARSRGYWIRRVQEQQFADEIALLRGGKAVPKSSPIFRLYPFLDTEGILRVGGRLENSPLSYDEKHPVILSAKAHFVRLLAVDSHLRTLHGGPQLTLNQLHHRYWIVGGRNLVRKIIRTCITCLRHARSPTEAPLMGQLPASRVTPARPFLHSGLDYAGPIRLRHSKGRGRTTFKGYIALFVCMATKAIHLEAVSDCSTPAFLAAFKRFCSRRGIPSTLSSDQATTFKGADAELRNLLASASREHADLADSLSKDGTQWHFIPPHSPHFGGLWEAGVKSVKTHLQRTIGDTILTFEELTTVLAEIEACLNSRPLTQLSTSPRDLSPLTPGHFLIGSPLTAIPEPSLLNENPNRLTRWQLLRRLSEQFWRRWSKEYTQQLQLRQKWATQTVNVQPGDLVLIKEDHLPPSKWHLGRVIQTHPGEDGVVRVVTVRTSASTYRRPVVKLRKLPVS